MSHKMVSLKIFWSQYGIKRPETCELARKHYQKSQEKNAEKIKDAKQKQQAVARKISQLEDKKQLSYEKIDMIKCQV